MKSENFLKFVYSSIRQLYCCDITDLSTVSPERAACKKLTRTLKYHRLFDWTNPNLPKLLLFRFLKSFSIHSICINACESFSFNAIKLLDAIHLKDNAHAHMTYIYIHIHTQTHQQILGVNFFLNTFWSWITQKVWNQFWSNLHSK